MTPKRRDEVYALVREVLIESLSVDEEDIKPHLILDKDLGAESLDLLDIEFRIQRKLDMRIPASQLFDAKYSGADPAYHLSITVEKLVDRLYNLINRKER